MRDGIFPSAMTRSNAVAPMTSTLARVVSKCVLLGTMSPGLRTLPKRDTFGRASLVGGNDVFEVGDVAHASSKRKKDRLPA